MKVALLKPLVSALDDARSMTGLDLGEWALMISQARNAEVLSRLGAFAQDASFRSELPTAPLRHLDSAHLLAERQHSEMFHEVGHIERALAPLGIPVVLLKGAAYVLQGSRAAIGRMVSDIDILVPVDRIAEVESALMLAGWVSSNRSEYDQDYYRKWMHEIPPLRHMHRGTSLDVHHAILPLTARFKPDSRLLLEASLPINGDGSVRVLSHLDQVLHSAAHLFHEGELELGFRGLVDLDALLKEACVGPEDWTALLSRSSALQLDWPLFQALRYTRRVLGTPVPEQVMQSLAKRPSCNVHAGRLRLMDALYLRALRPSHASLDDRWTAAARFLLYVRGHWMRMPPGLLARHLLRKLLTVWQSTPAKA